MSAVVQQSPCILHGYGHLRTLADAVRIRVSDDIHKAVWYRMRYHADIRVADMQCCALSAQVSVQMATILSKNCN